MVKRFKVMHDTTPTYEIEETVVNNVLERQDPWYRRNAGGNMRYYAVCPKCENPIQLLNVTGNLNAGAIPHGRHENGRVGGFPFFDGEALATCPHVTKNLDSQPGDRRPMSEMAIRIIRIAVENFDRVVLVLRRDLGIYFSDDVAGNMLDAWFGVEGYRYRGANLENIPWMIAYFAPTMNLFGKDLSRNTELLEAIQRRVPNAKIENGRLVKGDAYCELGLSSLRHHVAKNGEEIEESLTINVRDFSKTKIPLDAPRVYHRLLQIDPAEFERLRRIPPERAKRNEALLQVAREIARRHNVSI